MLDICHKERDDSLFPVIFKIMKSTGLARTQNYDLNKLFKEKKRRKGVFRRLSSTPSREGDIVCHSTYNCLYLSIQNPNGYP